MGLFKPNIEKLEQKQDIARLVKALEHVLGDVRGQAAAALDRLGWTPADDAEKGRYLVAKGEWGTLVALGVAAVEPVIQAMKSVDKDMAKRAETALEEIAAAYPAAAVEPLIAALEDSAVQLRVAEILGQIGDTRAVGPMVEALKRGTHALATLKEEGSLIPMGLVEALVAIGEPAVEPLIEALAKKVSSAPASVYDVYDATGSQEELGQVIMGGARAGAAIALRLIGDSRATGVFVQALGDEDPTVCSHAAKALAEIGEPAVVPLIGALGDIRQQVRWMAAGALGKIGDARAVDSLTQVLLTDRHRWARAAAANALGAIGDARALGPLIQALRDIDERVKAAAAKALGTIGDTRAVDPLIQALRDTRISAAAAEALGDIGDPRAAGHLLLIQAHHALVRIGAPAVDYLTRALEAQKLEIRQTAATALGGIGADAAPAVPALIRCLHHGPAMAAADALGKIGPAAAAAIPSLIPIIGEGWLLSRSAWLALKAITGQDLPKNRTVWHQWWVEHASEYAIPQVGPSPPPATVCPQCGSPVRPDQRFCVTCGTKLS